VQKQREEKSKVLVCPLNWGLGHATRCIPIIRSLLDLGTEVALASDGRSLALLKKNFPDLPAFDLPGYGISYPTANMAFNIFFKSPRILSAMLGEKRRTAQIRQQFPFTHLLSDNRFGCYHPQAQNLFMTHQFYLPLQAATSINLFLMRKFDRWWVPDYAAENQLSGKLSHPAPPDMQVQYIGPLSQFDLPQTNNKPDSKEEELCLALISGPEPQRSKLENQLIEQIQNSRLQSKKWVLVGGKAESSEQTQINKHFRYFSHLDGEQLYQLLRQAKVVICRSGYTSLMDLLMLSKKALLIPTPGQDEQEYLARKFAERQGFLVRKQDELQIDDDLSLLDSMPRPQAIPSNLPNLKKALQNWLQA